ncbi:MAG TPA: U32 family peptidase [Patescibacteria group bacterium]|nr:U32 family peptidase [Patescibacteria group bacterium]
MKRPELLAPAGNLEKLKIALAYGADAVYLGGKAFGLRAFSDNFDDEEMKQGVAYAHSLGKKVYVTLNVFPHNDDLGELPDYLRVLVANQVDGVILSDPGVYRILRQIVPELPFHISTQANNTNWASVQFWQDLGARRVVLSRELKATDIQTIRDHTMLELEVFVHGAMCISYSGRCLLSNYFTARDANRGECAQPCRWKYFLMEETRPGQYFPVLEDDRGSYIFNSRDLCLLPYLPDLLRMGVDSCKIEGRMKSVHYVASVVKVYRQALDACLADPSGYAVRDEWREELVKISHREYTAGFFADDGQVRQIYTGSSYSQTHDFIGLVLAYDPVSQRALVEQRNNMKVGDEVEVLCPAGNNFHQSLEMMQDEEGQSITVAPHAQQRIHIPMVQPVEPFAMLRRKERRQP